MKWQKYTWKDGDPITTQKLNHIEYGIDRVWWSGSGKAGSKSLMVIEKHDPELVEDYLDIDADKLVQAIKSGVSVMLIPWDTLSDGEVSPMTYFSDYIHEESLTDDQIYSAQIQFFNGKEYVYGMSHDERVYSRFTERSNQGGFTN